MLRRIAPGTIEPTGGYFVATPDDPDDYLERFPAACAAAGIEAQPVPLADLFRAEPLLSREIRAAYRVPDAATGAVGAGRRATSPAPASTEPLAHRYHPVIGFERGPGRCHRAPCGRVTPEPGRRRRSPAARSCRRPGAWAGQVAALAGATLQMSPGKGSMLILNRRMTSAVVNRLAPPGDGDILVPVHTVCILGTTDTTVADPDDARVTRDEVDALLADGERLVPGLSSARGSCAPTPARARCTTPPALDGDGHHDESREISRAHHVIDHGARDGVGGLWSIVGGKLTTYRLMARDVVDAVARSLGVDAPCRTADEAAAGAGRPQPVLARRPAGRARGRGWRGRRAGVRVRARHRRAADRGARPARRFVAG